MQLRNGESCILAQHIFPQLHITAMPLKLENQNKRLSLGVEGYVFSL